MKVYLSPIAGKKIENIVAYLEAEWSQKVKQDFLIRFKKAIKRIGDKPLSYPRSNVRPDIHKCVLTKHNTLYFRIPDNEVEIITAIDNRQDPKKVIDDFKKYFS